MIRHEARRARPARALRPVHGPRARAAGRRLRAHRGDLRHRGRLRRGGRRVAGRCTRATWPWRAAACARSRPASAEIKRMFVTASARGRGHARALLAELERLAAEDGCERVRLYTTEVLREARALYTRVRLPPGGGRRDRRAHRPVAGEGDHAPLDATSSARQAATAQTPCRVAVRPCTTPVQRPRSSGWRSSPAPAAGWARRSCSGWPPTASRSRRATSGPRRDPRCTRELDVVDRGAVGAFVARVEAELGPPGVVVTAAGVQRTGPSETVEEEDWRRVIDVNLTGTWNVDPGGAAGDARRGTAGASSRSPRRSASPASSATRPTRHPRAA